MRVGVRPIVQQIPGGVVVEGTIYAVDVGSRDLVGDTVVIGIMLLSL